MQTILRDLLALSGLRGVEVVAGGSHGVNSQRGDHRRLTALGWRPCVPLKRSLQDTLDDWRSRVAADAAAGSSRQTKRRPRRRNSVTAARSGNAK
jgi:hypothetical protein